MSFVTIKKGRLNVPREPRVYVENVLYFVTARVNHDQILFHDTQDYAEYLKPLSEYKLLNGFKLFAYALMPQQLCLLIELRNNVTISTVMHNLNSRYTKTYNSRYKTKGHLFQGRFKSILVEKEKFLLRLTRHIHMFPGYVKAAQDIAQYPYSSYPVYLSNNATDYNVLEKPDMAQEIREVLRHLKQDGTDEKLKDAYREYIDSADPKEFKEVGRLMHRTACVGSKEFVNEIKRKIDQHYREEEKARVVRKSNPAVLFAGGLTAVFLGLAAFMFYRSQTALQDTLNVTTNGFAAAREDLVKRVNSLKTEVTEYEQKENQGLGGLAWELQLTPVKEEERSYSYKDLLEFKEGRVVSANLIERGYPPFNYTISQQTHGKMIWQTTQTHADGTTVRWYGIIAGGKMRGVFSEIPVQGQSRDFSFVSVGRLNNG